MRLSSPASRHGFTLTATTAAGTPARARMRKIAQERAAETPGCDPRLEPNDYE